LNKNVTRRSLSLILLADNIFRRHVITLFVAADALNKTLAHAITQPHYHLSSALTTTTYGASASHCRHAITPTVIIISSRPEFIRHCALPSISSSLFRDEFEVLKRWLSG
jgi:hypothetical protein